MNRRSFVSSAVGAVVALRHGMSGRPVSAALFGSGIDDGCNSVRTRDHDRTAATPMESSQTFSATQQAADEQKGQREMRRPIQTNSFYQTRSNSVPWDEDRWRPWLVQVNERDVTHLIGYNATTAGEVQLTSARDVEPRKVPFGFIGTGDSLRWDVSATEEGEYSVAVLYHPGSTDNIGSEIVVESGLASVRGRVLPVKSGTWKGGPQDRPSFGRISLTGTIKIPAGRSTLTLRVLPTSRQKALAHTDLAKPVIGWPKRSLHIFSVELARPNILKRMSINSSLCRSSTGWMVKQQYGLFIHWVPESYPLYGDVPAWKHYERAVDAFNVDSFVEMVVATGAGWVVFTTTHGKYYFPGPLIAMDRVLPGRTCKRDLIGELSDALSRKGIRLLLYFHPGPGPTEDPAWAAAAGISPVDDDKNIRIMLDMYREIGKRYGRRLAGWFVDGGDAYYMRNFSFRDLTCALKNGNPDRVVTFFQWLFPIFSPYGGDFTSDLVDFGAPLPGPFPESWLSAGGPYEGLEPQFNFTLEDEWYPSQPMQGKWPAQRYSTETLVDYFRKMAANRWPLTINVVISQDVTDSQPFVNPVSLQKMVTVKKALSATRATRIRSDMPTSPGAGRPTSAAGQLRRS